MDIEVLIKSAAKDLRHIIEFGHERDQLSKVRLEIELGLRNYDESFDQLLFLKEVFEVNQDLLNKHNIKCKSDPNKCVQNIHYSNVKLFIEQKIKKLNPSFEYSILTPNINAALIKENKVDLSAHPEVAKVYLSALDKLNQGSYHRNLLDDLRLTMELLLKKILANDRPLEKQNEELGKYLQRKNVSIEVRNMFVTVITYFVRYQNSYIKHDDNVNKQEVELILNLTSTFIKFLLHI